MGDKTSYQQFGITKVLYGMVKHYSHPHAAKWLLCGANVHVANVFIFPLG